MGQTAGEMPALPFSRPWGKLCWLFVRNTYGPSGHSVCFPFTKDQRTIQRADAMKRSIDSPLFFAKPAAFRAWLEKNHQTIAEQWVGFHRKASGRPSITWPEAVDEALCFGWIDGLRKTVNAGSYKIRFTPRRATSNWSAINIARMKELIQDGRVRPAGITAFKKRTPAKSRVYSYEDRKSAKLSGGATKLFSANAAAWKFFQQQPQSYRQTAIWWISSAKRPETQKNRLQRLIASSKAGRRLWR
jgi:uncharacterized protein YdeI (YjbR/CyaY-like superfamily)